MSSTASGVTSYNIEDYEYFRNVEMIVPQPETIRAYIPKYMPYIKEGTWQSNSLISLGTQMNAKDCKVSLPKTVTEQGFLTLTHYSNEHPDFTEKATEIAPGVLRVLPGSTFIAEILNNDPMSIKFTGKV
jgi:hypothetical protein